MSANINELPCQKKKVILCSNLTDTTALNLVNKQSTTKNTVKNIGLPENYFTEELQIKTLLTPLSKHIPPLHYSPASYVYWQSSLHLDATKIPISPVPKTRKSTRNYLQIKQDT